MFGKIIHDTFQNTKKQMFIAVIVIVYILDFGIPHFCAILAVLVAKWPFKKR